MEQILKYPYLKVSTQAINHPYTGPILGVLVFVLLTYWSPQLPMAQWWNHPALKIIMKLLVIVIIAGLHRWRPLVALAVALLIIIIAFVYANGHKLDQPPSVQVYQKPGPEEVEQINQEVTAEMKVIPKTTPGLHPLNRPTEETLYMDHRIFDPNNPNQPTNKLFNNPNLDTAIYELNPPFANKNLPSDEHLNIASVELPKGGPTRYSAYHGYKLT